MFDHLLDEDGKTRDEALTYRLGRADEPREFVVTEENIVPLTG